MKKFLALAVFLLLIPIVFSKKAYARDTGIDPYRVLCISSYNYAYPTVPDQLDGFIDGLSDLPVDVVYEFMNAQSYYKAADFSAFHEYLSYKMQQSEKYDLVVLFDDTALHFGLNYYEELFDGLPMVFSCVNNVADAEVASARDYITGITQNLDFEANIELARKLFPDRDHVVLIIDNSSTAQGEYKEFQRYISTRESDTPLDVSVINASNYSKKGLERAISEIDPDDSYILYISCLEDGEGHFYTMTTGTALIRANAPNVPIWRLTLADMQRGVFGGIAFSYYDASVRTGEMVAEILNGKDIKDMPMEQNSANHTYFDQKELDRFSVKKSLLPLDATILNEHRTIKIFYEENTLLSNIVILILVLASALIIFLYYTNRQRSRLIMQDYLTRMPNRPYIIGKLRQVTESKESFGIIMMDVDYYKEINDSLGHDVGDQLLVSIGTRLKAFSNKELIFARIGGDEFMGLIYHADKEKAEKICKDLVQIMCRTYNLPSCNVNITVSVGAAVYPVDTDDAEHLTNFADAALYEVKKNGRNGYRIFKPEYLENIGKAPL